MNQTYMKEKPVFPLLISMGIPMIISMIVGALYNIIDSIFVSMISENSMTATSLVYPLQNIAHSVGVGFGIGVNSLIARRLGEGKTEDAHRAASSGAFLSLVHGVVITALGFLIIRPFLTMFTSDAEVLSYGLKYFNIVFLFSTADCISMCYEKIYQSLGKMKLSMVGVMIGFAVNLILDPVMIFGIGFFPEMGIQGAALATGLGQLSTMVFYLILIKVHPLSIHISVKYMLPKRSISRALYSVGIASTLNMALASLLLSALNGILAPFGQSYILILGVYYKLQALLYQAACGLVQGMRPLMSYNYGAGEHKRVNQIFRDSILIVAAIMLAGMLSCQIVPGTLIGLFTSNPETIQGGALTLRIISWGFVVSSVSVVASGALEALGKGISSLVISLCRYVVIILPVAFLLSRIWGPLGVWHAFWIAETFTAFLSYYIYRSSVKTSFSQKELLRTPRSSQA